MTNGLWSSLIRASTGSCWLDEERELLFERPPPELPDFFVTFFPAPLAAFAVAFFAME
jgi:hypothetical protein